MKIKEALEIMKTIKNVENIIKERKFIDLIIKPVSSSGHSGRIYVPRKYEGKEAIILILDNKEGD